MTIKQKILEAFTRKGDTRKIEILSMIPETKTKDLFCCIYGVDNRIEKRIIIADEVTNEFYIIRYC